MTRGKKNSGGGGGGGRGGDRDGGGGGRGGRGGDRGKKNSGGGGRRRHGAAAVAVGGSGGRGRGGGRGGGRATGTDDDPFVVGISQKEKNKRQRENLARYPDLGFTHFVERTEFQGRGSAHGHALWWHPHAPTDAEDEEEDARGWRMRERDGCIAFVLVECDAEECARGACPRLCSSILIPGSY